MSQQTPRDFLITCIKKKLAAIEHDHAYYNDLLRETMRADPKDPALILAAMLERVRHEV